MQTIWRHHWSNLHNRKTSISLKRKKIFQKEKHHSSVFWKAFQISTNYFSLHRHFNSVSNIYSKTAIDSSGSFMYYLILLARKKVAQMAQKWLKFIEPFNVSHILIPTWQKEFQLIMQGFFSFKKFTYASFKNISALILSASPPGGSRSNFFTPSVSRPVGKQTTKTETWYFDYRFKTQTSQQLTVIKWCKIRKEQKACMEAGQEGTDWILRWWCKLYCW